MEKTLKKRLFSLFCVPVLLLLLAGCSNKKASRRMEKPEQLISKDTMTRVLVHLHLAEGKATALEVSQDSANEMYNLMKHNIYHRYKVRPKAFRKSYEYYLRDLETFNEIYSAVIDSINYREDIGKLD